MEAIEFSTGWPGQASSAGDLIKDLKEVRNANEWGWESEELCSSPESISTCVTTGKSCVALCLL